MLQGMAERLSLEAGQQQLPGSGCSCGMSAPGAVLSPTWLGGQALEITASGSQVKNAVILIKPLPESKGRRKEEKL